MMELWKDTSEQKFEGLLWVGGGGNEGDLDQKQNSLQENGDFPLTNACAINIGNS